MFAASKTASGVANYIEDVFSTWLYTGTGASQTITNNIDLSTYGGMTWIKGRSGATNNNLFDTSQGATKLTHSNTTDSTTTVANSLTAFTTSGFTLGTGNTAGSQVNTSAATYASWSFREKPKFFDVVTYTGTGSNTTIAHNLGSVPGCIMVKRTDSTGDWQVYHRSLANTEYIVLNTTAAKATGATRWNSTTATGAVFSLGTDANVNASGGTYVAYVFAHNAGGFGLTGADNVISCGSFVTDANALATVTLGYEPQWLLAKNSNGGENWFLVDNMRGFNLTNTARLYSNTSGAESAAGVPVFSPTSTGFTCPTIGNLTANQTYIYIAIRRGPMKVPTSGTSVYNAILRAGTGAAATVSGVGFSPDLSVDTSTDFGGDRVWIDKLRGNRVWMRSNDTIADTTNTNSITGWTNNGVVLGTGAAVDINDSGRNYINWYFKRASSFFDEVCYTGTGVARTLTHNLGAVPELIIVKSRSSTTLDWTVYNSGSGNTKGLFLNLTDAEFTTSAWNNTTPTSSVFSTGTTGSVNQNGATYVAYLFATCSGVSKVGSYTGNGTSQTINCGLTAGARFVLIKRTDTTSDWYVWDTVRGMTVLTDPYLTFNTTSAEVATLGSVTTVATGFALNSTILAAINENAGTYIFLAIA